MESEAAHRDTLKNEELPALFWDDMPDNAEENPDMAAINAIIDETSPEERAMGFKDQGNRALQTGVKHRKKFYLRRAIEQYTEGLGVGCEDKTLVSQLYCNRAHVNLLLENYRNAMMDGKDAVRYDPMNVKGYYRAAKAASALSLWEECRAYCKSGLEIEADNEGILKILHGSVAEEERRKKAAAAEAARQYELRRPAAKLADALLDRGWRIGRPQFGIGDRKPRLEGGEFRWPVLFFYPEASMQNDAIEDFGEFDTFGAHLDVLFGEDAPELAWDTEHQYTRSSVEVYYLSNAAKAIDRNQLIEALYGGWPSIVDEGPERYGSRSARWVRVMDKQSLGDVLESSDYVIPGVPVFFILSHTTPFKDTFLDGDIPLL